MAKLLHAGITVADINRTIEWYARYFGCTVEKQFSKDELEISGAVLRLGDSTIEVLQPFTLDERPGHGSSLVQCLRRPGCNHIAVTVDDLNSVYALMQQDGCHLISELVGGKMFFCSDPDGTLLEIKG